MLFMYCSESLNCAQRPLVIACEVSETPNERDGLARHRNRFATAGTLCFNKRRQLGKPRFARRDTLLHRALIAPQHFCSRRLTDTAELKIKKKLEFPALEAAALYPALDQFLNHPVKLAEFYVLNELLFHH